MLEAIVALIGERVGGALRRAAGTAAAAMLVGLFLLFALAGLFVALFFWVEPEHGAVGAALGCVAVACLLAFLSALPLLITPRRPRPQPADANLSQLLAQVTKTTSQMTTSQMILTAGLIGFALLLSARRSDRK